MRKETAALRPRRARSLLLRWPVVRSSSSSSKFLPMHPSRPECSGRSPLLDPSLRVRSRGTQFVVDCRRGERGSVRPPARWRFRARYPPLNHSLPHLPAYLAETSVLAQSRPIVSTRSELWADWARLRVTSCERSSRSLSASTRRLDRQARRREKGRLSRSRA